MASKNRVTVNLEDAEFEALQKLATKLDRPLAWVGRRAICDLIANEETGITSKLDRGERDGSEGVRQ